MSKREVIDLVCDVCGKDQNQTVVATRRVVVDGTAVEAEVCDSDWAEVLAAFAVFAKAGRPLKTKTRTPGAKEYPGTEWRFSSHALIRLGERKIDPLKAVACAERPDLTRPGNAADLEIRQKGRLKVVVAPERAVIITVAHHDEELDH